MPKKATDVAIYINSWNPGVKESWLATLAHWDELRHKCEVRHCLRLRWETGTKDAVDGYLERAAEERGPEAMERLRASIVEQWLLRNRGVGMDWRQPEPL